MGIIFGKIDVEVPKYEVVKSFDRDDYKYEIRRYPESVAAEVSSDHLDVPSSRFSNEAFGILAKYIGVFGRPANTQRESNATTEPVQTSVDEGEKVAMTAPVITTTGEKVAMTAPVITTTGEKVAMTAPVITTTGEKVAMTAPVITTTGEKVAMTAPVIPTTGEKVAMTAPVIPTTGEKVAMTAPVITTTGEKVAMTAPVITTASTQASGDSVGEQEKIAMTAPVLTSGGEHQTMAFLLPSKYTTDNAPEPTDARVKLKEIPPRYEAVHQYNGRSDMTNCGPKVEQLREHLQLDGVKVREGGSWHLDRYNPPFTIPWLRTNEIHIPVEFNSDL